MLPDIELPELYYVLTTMTNESFMFDVEEGQRISAVLEAFTDDTSGKEKLFLVGKLYGGEPFRCHIALCAAFYLSTPNFRALDLAWKKRSELEG